MATDPNQTAAINAINTGLSNRPVTVAALTAVLATIVTLIFSSITGLSTQIASIATPLVVPVRVATGATATTSAGDFLVCLNGPTSVQLEASPPVGTTHVLADCRASGGASISITPAGSDTINGGSSVAFTTAAQEMAVTYSPLGWRGY